MKTVLVAEDNPISRELFRELLEIRRYTVAEACNGQEAVAMVEQSPPDILLLDIGMPLLDGFGVVRKLRENPRFTSLPVVAVPALPSGRPRENHELRLMDTYLSPLTPFP